MAARPHSQNNFFNIFNLRDAIVLIKNLPQLKKLSFVLMGLVFSATVFAVVQPAPPSSVNIELPEAAAANIAQPVPITVTTTLAENTAPTSAAPATATAPASTANIPTPAVQPVPTPGQQIAAPQQQIATPAIKPVPTPAQQIAAPTPVPVPTPKPASLSNSPNALNIIPKAPDIDAKGYLLIEGNSGYVLSQVNADQRMAPASLTKLMTMYVISGLLKSGRIHLTDQVTISENAWRTGGSRMFIKLGTQVPVQDLVNGIIVASGNDACVAMAEFVAGSEESFVDLMNKTAQQLGMNGTHYADATGLPNPDNYTTPYDLAILARAIINNFPEDFKWYSQKWMEYNNIKQPNRNLLLWRDPTVDGLKTGHTEEAGYCLVASAKRNDTRLIAIVMGAPSMKQRATDAQELLNFGFSFYESHKLFAQNATLTSARTWYGKNDTTPLGVNKDFYATVPKGSYNKLKASLSIDPTIKAPITKGQQLGTIQVTLNNEVVASQPLIALEDNPQGNIFSRGIDHIIYLFKHA